MLVLGEDDGEDRVGAAARLVHVGGGHGPRLVALLHEVVDVVVAGDGQLAQVLHVGAEQRVLPHAEVALAVGVQEVADTLAVDLHVTHLRNTVLHLYRMVQTKYITSIYYIVYENLPPRNTEHQDHCHH